MENKKNEETTEENVEVCQKCEEKVEGATVQIEKDEAKKPKKSREKLMIFIGIILVLLITIFVILNMLPLKITYELPQDTTYTTTGIFKDISFKIKANQIIADVYYAVEPKNNEDLREYTKLDSKGLLSKTIKLPELKVPPGESDVYIYIKTIFGKKEIISLKFEHSVGNVSVPESGAIVTTEKGSKLISNELLITVKDNVNKEELEEVIKKHNGEIVGQINFMNQYQVRFKGHGENFINNLKTEIEKNDIVEDIYFNLVLDIAVGAEPNDKNFDSWDVENPAGNNWGLECIDAPGAWEYNDQMKPVKVGVIDSFLDYEHEDLQIDPSHVYVLPSTLLKDDFKTSKDLLDYYKKHANDDMHKKVNHNITNPCTFCNKKDHGTHCTGIIGAISNDKGMCGVNWNADMYFTTMSHYTLTNDEQLQVFDTSMTLNYNINLMVMSGCRVVNMSFGYNKPSEFDQQYEPSEVEYLDDCIAKLEKEFDFLLVKAAGNENNDASKHKLNRIMNAGEHTRAHTIIVGAVTNVAPLPDGLSSWIGEEKHRIYNMRSTSNFGELVDICAPGTDIYSTMYGSEYKNMSGTSMAAPMVSGVASLLYSMNETLTYDQVKSIVLNTPKDFCSKNGEIYSIVNAKNAVEFVSKNTKEMPKVNKPVVGFITGIVQDAKTLDLLDKVMIRITNNETKDWKITSTEKGLYDFMLQPGTYTMEVGTDKYIMETIYNVVITEGIINYNVLLNLVEDSKEMGTASGRIVDAFDASSIKNAQMTFYKGINQTTGEVAATTTSDESGQYTISLLPGNYTVHVSAEGYQADHTTILIIGSKTTNSQDCTLTPILKEGEVRIVLTWGEKPRDLDSHLVGPNPEGSKFHTYYSNKNYYYNDIKYVNLDVDDTSSYGPETTSVYVGVNGTYTFYVHDYSNKELSTSDIMSKSGAQVKVYVAGELTPTIYNVPNQPGTVWTVCSITAGVITPINTMGYEKDNAKIGQ